LGYSCRVLSPFGQNPNYLVSPCWVKPVEFRSYHTQHSNHFLNFFLNHASPRRPEPKRSMVAGSGTGLVCWYIVACVYDQSRYPNRGWENAAPLYRAPVRSIDPAPSIKHVKCKVANGRSPLWKESLKRSRLWGIKFSPFFSPRQKPV
jgi:hypothetical protein